MQGLEPRIERGTKVTSERVARQVVAGSQRSTTRRTGVVVIGAGQAGISVSYYLKSRGVPHVVLERDTAFSSWASRWDGFVANTPSWMNTLPMVEAGVVPSGSPNTFATRDELLDYLNLCLREVEPPLEVGCNVDRVSQLASGDWRVQAGEMVFECESVVVATGAMAIPRLPEAAREVDGLTPQMHSSEYRRPEQIETDRVLVVGSASSGVQICRLLAESGRFGEISIAVSRVMVLPKRILGIQTHRFLHSLGLFDVTSRSAVGRIMYSGLETKGDPIMRPAPRDLSRQHGVKLLGRFTGVHDGLLSFSDGQSLATSGLTILWCTGFTWDYGFIEVNSRESVFDERGYPVHRRGVVDNAPGLYFVGLRYQHTVASHDIYGVGADALFVSGQIVERSTGLSALRVGGGRE